MTTTQHVINIIKLVYRCGCRLVAVLLLIVLIENLWSSMQQTSLADLQTHSQQLVELMAAQEATKRVIGLSKMTKKIAALVDRLTEHRLVEFSAIYDNYWQVVVSADAVTEQPEQVFVVVEEVREDSLIHGYLHVTVNQPLLLAEPLATHEYLTYYGQYLIYLRYCRCSSYHYLQ